jgi:glucose-1-phosphatase
MKLSDAIYNGKTEIKNIIFDWGGVITDLHWDAMIKAFKKIGFSIDTEPGVLNDLFIPFETGMISSDEFRNKIRKYANAPLSNAVIDEAWNSILGKLPQERWNILEKAHNRYRTFLLSNTNVIHQQYYFNVLKDTYGTSGFSHLFEKVYFSFVLHMRKPNSDIFQYVLNDAGIECSETIFIDDFEENIETARRIGFQTIHLTSPLELADIFKFQKGGSSE